MEKIVIKSLVLASLLLAGRPLFGQDQPLDRLAKEKAS
jgi:hypothetical protein